MYCALFVSLYCPSHCFVSMSNPLSCALLVSVSDPLSCALFVSLSDPPSCVLFVLMSDPVYCALFVSMSVPHAFCTLCVNVRSPVLCTVRVNVRPPQCTVHSLCQCPTPVLCLFVSMFCPLSASALFELNVNFRPIVLWTLCVNVSVRLSCALFALSVPSWQTVLGTLCVDCLVHAFCGRQSCVHFLWLVLCMLSVANSLGSTFCRQPWRTAVYALTAFVWLRGWIYK